MLVIGAMSKSLTICIPTNRDFNNSKQSIFSAISFCENNNANLIISDNSKDENKKEILKGVKLPFMKYIFDGPEVAIENWWNSVKESNSSYTMVLSDDDLIFNIQDINIDYKELSKNYIIGIKPTISCWNEKLGIYKNNSFSIEEDDPLERMINYREKSAGDNTTMYSFFDTLILKDLLRLFMYHPTRGGYTDWAFMQAIVSSGKILNDNSKLLVYKNNNWAGDEKFIESKEKELFIKCGLTERGILFSMLFRAIDVYILVLRKNSPIKRAFLIQSAREVFLFYIDLFLINFKKNRDSFLLNEIEAIDKINLNASLEELLVCVLEVINSFNENLKTKYEKFYFESLDCEWGKIK